MTRRPPHPYARRHLAVHAAAGGMLDDVLSLDTLPYLDQARLASLLRLTEAEPNTVTWLLLSAWRSVRHRWSWDDPDANAAALDVAYRAVGGRATPNRPTTSGVTWRPLWVEWQSGGTIAAGEVRGQVRIAVGRLQGVPTLATTEWSRIQLWDPVTGQPIGEPLSAPAQLRALVLASAPGLLVGACQGGLLVVWDAVTRLRLTTLEIPEPAPRALAVGELDGTWVVAAGGTSGVLHVHALDGREVRTLPGEAPVRDAALATADDGALYVAAGYGDGYVRTYDLRLGTPEVASVSLGREINAVALVPSGDRLLLAAGSADGSARVWDALTGRPETEPLVHGGEVRSVAVTTTGPVKLLATGSEDRAARVWYIPGGSPTGPPLPHPAPVESVAFVEVDGRTMLGTGCLDGNTRLWDPVQPSAPRVAVDWWSSSLGLDDTVVVAGADDGSAHLWDRRSGSRHPALPVQPGDEPGYKALHGAEVGVRLGFVRDRRTLVTLHRGRVAAWDLNHPDAPVVLGTTTTGNGRLADATVTGDRALVASADPTETVRVVDLLVPGPPVFRTPLQGVFGLRFLSSPGRALLAVENDIGLHLLDATSGAPVSVPLAARMPTHAAVGRLDGVDVLAALDPDGLRLYDLRSGELTLPPMEMSNTATGIAWVRVGDRDLLVTAHYATVRVWNPHTGRKVAELPFGTTIAGMAVHQTAGDVVTVAVSGPGVVLVELRAA